MACTSPSPVQNNYSAMQSSVRECKGKKCEGVGVGGNVSACEKLCLLCTDTDVVDDLAAVEEEQHNGCSCSGMKRDQQVTTSLQQTFLVKQSAPVTPGVFKLFV